MLSCIAFSYLFLARRARNFVTFRFMHKKFHSAQSKNIGGEIMRLNCGDVCPKTGSYKVIDGQGNIINTIYVGEGETMPPTQYSDCHYESES